MTDHSKRRPLSSRDTGWARSAAGWLARTSVTPNMISQTSIAFSAIAGLCFWLSGSADGAARILFLLGAALFCQARLLCNLFDGMVAVEGGKRSPDGPFWNEFPDRVADIVILAGAGYGLGDPALGWAAAAFAVLTAYVRELGAANGQPPDFSGPMAKPQRMAAMTVAAIIATTEPLWNGRDWSLTVALWVVAAGALATALLRARRLVRFLKAGGRS